MQLLSGYWIILFISCETDSKLISFNCRSGIQLRTASNGCSSDHAFWAQLLFGLLKEALPSLSSLFFSGSCGCQRA